MPEEQNLSEEKKEEVDEIVPEAVKEFLGDDEPKEEPPKEKEEAPEEKPAEEPVEEPAVPLEEVVEEVKTKTREEVKADVLKALGVTEEEKAEVEEAGYKTPWEKRNEDRPADWGEVLDAGAELQEFRAADRERKAEEVAKKEAEKAQEENVAINAEWDAQLDYLRAEGSIPGINPDIKKKLDEGKSLTVEERKDPGLAAQADVIETMYKVAQERETEGKKPIADIVHIFNRYYKPKNKQPAGAKAPVSGGKKSVATGEPEELSYDELHNTPFEGLVNMP